MANQLLKDVHTLVDKVVEETDMMAGFSKALPTFGMGDVDGQRYDDVEYLPEDYRFEANDGYKSQSDNSDVEGLIDRLIPIKRTQAKYVKTTITTKELRDPRLRDQAAKGFARELRNVVDKYCYEKAITRANMAVTSGSAIQVSDMSTAEMTMLDAGLGGYAKCAHVSLPHYKTLGDKLASNDPVNGKLPVNAYERAQIPNGVAGFDKVQRSDYRLTLKGQTATGVTITGNQSHTVQTKDGNDNYIDNRQMPLIVSDTSGIVAGDKFTIAGINRLNPEVREDTSELQTFTVISNDSGVSLTVSPAIVSEGAYRNCTAEASGGAAITFLNTSDNNPTVFWAEDSIKLIPGNLPVTEGAGVKKVDSVTEQGLPMRFTYKYDFDEEELIMKAVVFFDCEVWLPSQVGVLLDNQS